MEPLQIGAKAPHFNLQDQDENTVSLDSFTGKFVILYFYPRAMTPGCTKQACALRDIKTELAELNAVPLGVSPDKPAALKKFETKENLNFTLLADTENEVAKAYHAWQEKSMYGKKFMGINRMTYIINPAGEIAAVIPKVKAASHHDDVVKLLKKISD